MDEHADLTVGKIDACCKTLICAAGVCDSVNYFINVGVACGSEKSMGCPVGVSLHVCFFVGDDGSLFARDGTVNGIDSERIAPCMVCDYVSVFCNGVIAFSPIKCAYGDSEDCRNENCRKKDCKSFLHCFFTFLKNIWSISILSGIISHGNFDVNIFWHYFLILIYGNEKRGTVARSLRAKTNGLFTSLKE